MPAALVEIAAKDFLLGCRADGLKATTIRWYRYMLKPLTARFYGKAVDRVTVIELRQYVVDLRSRGRRYVNAPQRPEIPGGLSHESLRDHLRAMRRFFNWCVREYELDPARNPMLRIRMPPRQKAEPKSIVVDDLKRLLEACDDSVHGRRDRAMLAFLADTGCRAGGLLTLTLNNLHLPERYAIVTEKGDRSRAVPFTDYTVYLLLRWLEVRPYGSETVFVAIGGTRPGRPLTLSGLHAMLKRLKAEAAVSGRVNPHSIRHGFARQYLRNGGDLATLSQLMGHSDVSVTVASYARFTADELAEMHSKFSPMKNIREENR